MNTTKRKIKVRIHKDNKKYIKEGPKESGKDQRRVPSRTRREAQEYY